MPTSPAPLRGYLYKVRSALGRPRIAMALRIRRAIENLAVAARRVAGVGLEEPTTGTGHLGVGPHLRIMERGAQTIVRIGASPRCPGQRRGQSDGGNQQQTGLDNLPPRENTLTHQLTPLRFTV